MRPTTTLGFLGATNTSLPSNAPGSGAIPPIRAVTPHPHSSQQQQQPVYGAMSPYFSYSRTPSGLVTAAPGVGGTRVIEVPADTPPLLHHHQPPPPQQQQQQVKHQEQQPSLPPPFYYHTTEKRVRVGEEEGRDNGIFMPCSTRFVVPALWGDGGMNAAAAAAAAWARGAMGGGGGVGGGRGFSGGKGKSGSTSTKSHAHNNPPPFYPNNAMRL